MREIAVYGTGVCGNKIYNYLSELGVKISCFIKSTPVKNETFHNIPVLLAEEVIKYNNEIIVIIAIEDKQTIIQIYHRLLELGFDEKQIINLNSSIYNFILANAVYNAKQIHNEGEYFCNCCNNNVLEFLPKEFEKSKIYEKYHIIGGGYRAHSICPICEASDRNRWQKYVLENFTDIIQKECNVLHIAPEEHIYKLISLNTKCDYYLGDILRGKTDHKVDLTDIQFKDDFFDYIIANHVLEHIENLDLAFAEIKRVLKSTGKLIISFPICMDIKTKEDKSITKPEDRLIEYGQSDHVRLFGSDYKEYIEKRNFKVEVMSPQNMLTADVIKKYGMIENDVILICSIQ